MCYCPQTCGTAAPTVSPRLHFASSCLLNLLHNLTPSPQYNLSKYKHVYIIDNHESWPWELSEIDKVSQPSNQEFSTASFATEVRHYRVEDAALPQQLIWLQD